MNTINSLLSDVNEVKRKYPADTPARLLPALSKLAIKIDRETDPLAEVVDFWASDGKPVVRPKDDVDFWSSSLLVTDVDRVRQTEVRVQVQGSVVRTKKFSQKGESGSTFQRGWNNEPDMWSDDFLKDGYDRFNINDRTAFAPYKVSSGNKSEIKEFSSASRRNLMDKLCSLSEKTWGRVQFNTFTYHNDLPTPDEAKRHLRLLHKRIVYYCGRRKLNYKPAHIWRLEPQERGFPHFHMFLFNAPKIPEYMLLKWWQEITGDPTITQVKSLQRLDNRRKVMNYLNKYISKPTDYEKMRSKEASIVASVDAATSDEGALLDISLYWEKVGRYWGSEGLISDPDDPDYMFAPVNEMFVEITNDGLLQFVALLEKTFPFLVDRWSFGFRIFTYDKPADSIWALAALLINGEFVENSSGLDEWLLTVS
jgi:hypothetical protein